MKKNSYTESDLKEAYYFGWEDKENSRWCSIFGRRTPSKDEYFESFMERKKGENG